MKKTLYVPPQAKDLSAFGVSGEPLGACKSGGLPYYSCVAGPVHPPTDCLAGSGGDSSYCVAGGNHFYPSCNFGSAAVTACFSGGAQK